MTMKMLVLNKRYIGDSLSKDMLMAKQAGILSVWCNYQQKDVVDLYKKLVAISHWTEQDFQREEQYKYEWTSFILKRLFGGQIYFSGKQNRKEQKSVLRRA